MNFDLYESTKMVNLFGQRWTNSKFTFTIYKMISILLIKIDSLLANSTNMDENTYKLELQKIYDNYLEFYVKYNNKEYLEMFDIINQYLTSKLVYSYNTFTDENDFCKKLYYYFSKICNFNNTSIKDDNVSDIISQLLEIIITIIICKYGKKENKLVIVDNVYLTFDNIEHFIENNKVYNEDIVEITTTIQDFIDSQGSILKNCDFYSCFKFVLVVRDTTNKMISPTNSHNEDFYKNTVDISNWYDTVEIYNKKLEYYDTSGILDSIHNYMFIKKSIHYIFEDRTYTGLNTTLNYMYNNNKRRITRYLFDAISLYPKRFIKYVELWEKSKKTDGIISRIYKHVSRSIVKRSLYDIIEKTLYFENLKSIDTNKDETGLGLARRILTIMYRFNPALEDCDNYISFNTLISELLDSPCHSRLNTELIKNRIKTIVDILYLLNNSNIDETNWCQLVDIKFNRKTLNDSNKSIVENAIFEAYMNHDEDERYGIKITNAGKYFLNICPEFEYFSCRYRRDKEPIFCDDSIYSALKTISDVKKDTFKCIEKIIQNDKAFVSLNTGYNYNALYSEENGIIRHYLFAKNVTHIQDYGKEQHHILRILNSHISYIDMFRTLFLLESDLDNAEKTEISKTILNILDDYVKKIKEICSISSFNGDITTYLIGGYQRSYGKLTYNNLVDYEGKYYYQDYLKQLEEARKNPLEKSVHIIKG